MKVTVIGCGRWGSFLAWYNDHIGHKVTLYGPADTEHYQRFAQTRTNGLVTLNDSITLSCDIGCVHDADYIIISIGSQSLRGLMGELKDVGLAGKTVILCMKGIEVETGCRLSEIAEEFIGDKNEIAVWIGPGHVQEFTRGIPNCMVIDSRSDDVKHRLVDVFGSDLIRFYYGNDLIGNEIGAASKNVIGIAAGLLDGMGLSTLKGALMSRGTREIARLISAMGGSELSAYGLCHLGDYEATVFSEFSHNRKFGELFARGESYGELAEGVYTVKALMSLSEKYKVELPICEAVYNALYNNVPVREALAGLFGRSLKREF